jgi:DNA polymerase-3 subunit alpha
LGTSFSHLHVHTQFSLLDGAASIPSLFKKAAKDGQPALAITDHGNMFGAFKFVAEAGKHKNDDGTPKVKPIVGCEFYVVADRFKKTFTRDDKDKRFHQLMLAKNAEGYKNLSKLCSLGFMDGFYSKYPRIDKELIVKYHEGLIATTCCLGASVPQAIMRAGDGDLSAAEAEFKWWLDLFGEDYYIELQRHGIPEQDKVNAVLVQWARKYNVPIIASNDSHYTTARTATRTTSCCASTPARSRARPSPRMRTPPPRTSASASPTTSSSSRPRPRWPRPSAICRRPWTTPT